MTEWTSFTDLLQEKPAPETPAIASEHDSQKPLAIENASNLASEQSSKVVNYQVSNSAPQKRINREQLNVRISKQLLSQLDIWRFVNKKTKQEAVEMALNRLLASEHDSEIARIDNDLDEALKEEEILIFYREWTGNRITDGDRKAFDEVSMYHPDVIKSGILTTLYNARTSGRKINSFRYCLQEIQAAAAAPVHDARTRLQYVLSKLERKEK